VSNVGIARLSSAEMNSVGAILVSVIENCLAIYVGEQRKKLIAFLAEVVTRRKATMLVTPDGLKDIADLVFLDTAHRDFVQAITYGFYARWGANEAQTGSLLNNLADGACAQGGQVDWIAIPKAIQERLSPRDDILNTLAANRWLVILMLMKLYVVLDLKELAKPDRGPRAPA